MLKFCQVSLLAVSILFGFFGNNVQALPGQSTDEAVSWINGNATLRPALGDGLVVKKSETPAHRFQFQPSVLPPGRVHFPRDRTMVLRTEYNGSVFEEEVKLISDQYRTRQTYCYH